MIAFAHRRRAVGAKPDYSAFPLFQRPDWPALPWLALFSGDTGLTNQISGGGNNLVPAANAPTLLANQVGGRSAWSFAASRPDYFTLSLTAPTAQHWLVAFVVKVTTFSTNGAMILGSTSPQSLFTQLSGTTTQYVQSAAVTAGVTTGQYLVLVGFVDAAGLARLRDAANQIGVSTATAAPVTSGAHAFQVGNWPGGAGWALTGQLACLAVAGDASGFAAADAAAVASVLKSHYSL